ncbi:ABC transporter related protein [Pseudodesulfovibrio mercurii]|uniref:ABC transporter related protein n=1 Tax=Pseudodesulfovibrio mercurii TaxID=641491 RepID=F0JKW8_9BACT|nr:ABC transporter ATP-binding protein [Pseudodesulfovibrio mercurii]EGB16567.1 ABC transporter related protein [Pseudodesulfovibrio mercurii]
MDSATFALRDLGFAYGDVPVLRDLDLGFAPGLLHGVVGPNGSGKSTLLALLAGLLKPTSGAVRLDGEDVSACPPDRLARRCAMVAQDQPLRFPFTVAQTVLMGRHPHIPRFGRADARDREIVERALTAMDLADLRGRAVADLSGGERQRTAVARGLAQDTPVLLLDEPTSAMDIRHAMATMEELARLAEDGRTVVAVLHDLNLAARYCDAVLMLDNGAVHAYGNVSRTLTPENIHAVFGVRAAVLDTEHGPLIAYIQGNRS